MRSKLATILILVIAIVWQSCDMRSNIDPPQRFYKYIGKDGDQFGKDLTTDSEDNLYILGNTSSSQEGTQLYVVKTNSRGEVLWEQTLGDAGEEDAKDIELMAGGQLLILANRTNVNTGEKGYAVYRLSSADGSETASKIIDGEAGFPVYANTITETLDGFVVAAYTDHGPYKSATVARYDKNFVRFTASNWDPKLKQLSGSTGYDVIPFKVFQIDPTTFYGFYYSNSISGGDAIADYNFVVVVSTENNFPYRNFYLPGPDPNSNEFLTSVKAVPVKSGSGYIMTGYTSTAGGTQDVYAVRVVQSMRNTVSNDPTEVLQGSPKVITSGLSASSNWPATVFPSQGEGFLVLANENTQGNDNMFLKKVDNLLADAWADPVSHSFGGVGNDTPGAVIETSTGRIVICGTMVLGEVNGQKKVVLMNLNRNGMFDN